MKLRIIILTSLFALSFFVLIFNTYDLQFAKRDYYLAQAESRQRLNGVFETVRGNIYFTDKNNNLFPVVLNKNFDTIYAVPKEIEDPEETANVLSLILDKSAESLERMLSKPDDLYELLIQKASVETTDKIKSLDIEGIYFKSEAMRYYPFNNLASHILGFVSTDKNNEIKGRYGVESYFDDVLIGESVPSTRKGFLKKEANKDIVLTLDSNIQASADEILNSLVTQHNAEGGTIIVQEPSTGKILAMSSLPNFDPNSYSNYPVGNYLNPAVQAIYEPGSVFKVITMAAGLDSGKIEPNTTYNDTGSLTINGSTVRNWDLKAHGIQTMTEVIEQSINTGSIYAEKQVGHNNFYNYLEKFGFDEITGVNLPGEIKGNIRVLKTGRDINYATASYGQGVSVTPIALIKAFSALANDGVLMRPLILANDKPKVIRRVVSSETANQIADMMTSAVVKNKLAAISNYSVAGKTGTAFVPDFENGGYTHEVINTYIGFAPAYDPKFTILVKLAKPMGSPLAGATVVPAFRELSEFILNYYNIPPDKI